MKLFDITASTTNGLSSPDLLTNCRILSDIHYSQKVISGFERKESNFTVHLKCTMAFTGEHNLTFYKPLNVELFNVSVLRKDWKSHRKTEKWMSFGQGTTY